MRRLLSRVLVLITLTGVVCLGGCLPLYAPCERPTSCTPCGCCVRSRSPCGLRSANLWSTNAITKRGQIGRRYTHTCPANGRLGSVWGTGVYTDDSSICTAAVHAGRIAPDTGGTVTIEIRSGLPSYVGTTRNGVVSRRWNRWHGSFVFVCFARYEAHLAPTSSRFYSEALEKLLRPIN